MTHIVKLQTITYKNNTFNKGINEFGIGTTAWITLNADKIIFSTYYDRVVEQKPITNKDATDYVLSVAQQNPQAKFRFMLNVCGDQFNAILYKGDN